MAILFDALETNRLQLQDEAYEWEDGWSVFDAHSVTSLNRLPITVLSSYILSEYIEDPIIFDISVDMICESLLVDGSLVIAGGKLQHSNEWHVSSSTLGYQINEDQEIYRMYAFNGSSWSVGIYNDDDFIQLKETLELPTEELYMYANGEGIIKPVQWTYKRLEEIELSRRQQTTEAALSLIIAGYEGVDTLKIRRQVAGGAKILFIPTPDVNITRVASSEIVNYLSVNFDQLLPIYFKALNVPIMDGNSVQSGISRGISLQPTLRFCNNIRNKIVQIFEQLGGNIEFKPIILLSVEERLRELELINAKNALGIYTEQEFKDIVKLI